MLHCHIQNDTSLTDPSYAVKLEHLGLSWILPGHTRSENDKAAIARPQRQIIVRLAVFVKREKRVTLLSNVKCKFMLFQFGQKQKCTSKHLTSNHDLPPQVPRPYEENLSNAFSGQSTDEAAALEVVHL